MSNPGIPNPTFAGAPLPIVSQRRSANSLPATRVYDGRFDTSWFTLVSRPDNAWFRLNLGAVERITGIRWQFRMLGGADSMRVETSTDDSTWSVIGAFTNGPEINQWYGVEVDDNVQYVRFWFDNPNNRATLGYVSEVEIWGAPFGGQIQRTPRLQAEIGGEPTDVFAVTTSHGVDQPIGTATLDIPLPRADYIALNAPVEVQAGFDETTVQTIFSGRIIDISGTFNASGRTGRVRAEGWAALLNFEEATNLHYDAWPNPDGGYFFYRLRDVFTTLCDMREVPRYRSDVMLLPDGQNITVGGNQYINNRRATIDKRTTPLAWLTRAVELYGYRVFDAPIGEVLLQRVSGLPPDNGQTAGAFNEGENAYSFQRIDDVKPMVTYWEVFGPRYTDDDGVTVQYRSVPTEVPFSPELDPPGWRKRTISSDILSHPLRVDYCRQVQEIDHSEPYEAETFETDGDPTLQPGQVVEINAPSLGVAAGQRRWLMNVRHSVSDRGFTTTCEGWSGAGEPLPAQDDCVTLSLGAGPYHLGDEVIPWYAVPTPTNGIPTTQLWLNFTVPEDYTSITVRGLAHGTNSFFIDGETTENTVSRFEIHQNNQEVGRGTLPYQPEHYDRQYNYNLLQYWSQIVIPISGRLEQGPAALRIVSGENTRATLGPYDDFEVRDLTLTLCGAGVPILPSTMDGTAITAERSAAAARDEGDES